ncbi:MAG: hypothetical protein Q8K60_08355 [Parachlamydiaceae bacterium]|nr:hypothetical protein [Parachlamydiaceae bacterium]
MQNNPDILSHALRNPLYTSYLPVLIDIECNDESLVIEEQSPYQSIFDTFKKELVKSGDCDSNGNPLLNLPGDSPFYTCIASHQNPFIAKLEDVLQIEHEQINIKFTLLEFFNFFIKNLPNNDLHIDLMFDHPNKDTVSFFEKMTLELFPFVSPTMIYDFFNSDSMNKKINEHPFQYVISSSLKDQTIVEKIFIQFFLQKIPFTENLIQLKKLIVYKQYEENYFICGINLNKNTQFKFVFINNNSELLKENTWKISLDNYLFSSHKFSYALITSKGNQPFHEALLQFLINEWRPNLNSNPIDEWILFLKNGEFGTRTLIKSIEADLINKFVSKFFFNLYLDNYIKHINESLQKKSWRSQYSNLNIKPSLPSGHFENVKLIETTNSIESIKEILRYTIKQQHITQDKAFALIFRACHSLLSNNTVLNDELVPLLKLLSEPECFHPKKSPPLFCAINYAVNEETIPFSIIISWLTLEGILNQSFEVIEQNEQLYFFVQDPLNCLISTNINNAIKNFEKIFLDDKHTEALYRISEHLSSSNIIQDISLGFIQLLKFLKIDESDLKKFLSGYIYDKNIWLRFIALKLNFLFPINEQQLISLFRLIHQLCENMSQDRIEKLFIQLSMHHDLQKYNHLIHNLKSDLLRNKFIDQNWILYLAQSKQQCFINLAYELWIKENSQFFRNAFKSRTQNTFFQIDSEFNKVFFETLCQFTPNDALDFFHILIKESNLREKIDSNKMKTKFHSNLMKFLLLCFHLNRNKDHFQLNDSQIQKLIDLASFVFMDSITPSIKNIKNFRLSLHFFINLLYELPKFKMIGDNFLLKFNRLNFDLYHSDSKNWENRNNKWLSRLNEMIELNDTTKFEYIYFLFNTLVHEGFLNKKEINKKQWQSLLIQLSNMSIRYENTKWILHQKQNNQKINHSIQIDDFIADEEIILFNANMDKLCEKTDLLFPLVKLLSQQTISSNLKNSFDELVVNLFLLECEKEIYECKIYRLEALLNIANESTQEHLRNGIIKLLKNCISQNKFSHENIPFKSIDQILSKSIYTKILLDKNFVFNLTVYLDFKSQLDPKYFHSLDWNIFEIIILSNQVKVNSLSILAITYLRLIKLGKPNQHVKSWLFKYQKNLLSELNDKEKWKELFYLINYLNENQNLKLSLGIIAWNLCFHLLINNNFYDKKDEFFSNVLENEKNENWQFIESKNPDEIKLFLKIFLNTCDNLKAEIDLRAVKKILFLLNQKNCVSIISDECLVFIKSLSNFQQVEFLKIIPLTFLSDKTEEFQKIWFEIINNQKFIESIKHSISDARFLYLNNEFSSFYKKPSDFSLSIMNNFFASHFITQKTQSEEKIIFLLDLLEKYQINDQKIWKEMLSYLEKSSNKQIIEKGSLIFKIIHEKEYESITNSHFNYLLMFKCLQKIQHPILVKSLKTITMDQVLKIKSQDDQWDFINFYFLLLIDLASSKNDFDFILECRAKIFDELNILKNINELGNFFNSSNIDYLFAINLFIKIDYYSLQKYPRKNSNENFFTFFINILDTYMSSSEPLKKVSEHFNMINDLYEEYIEEFSNLNNLSNDFQILIFNFIKRCAYHFNGFSYLSALPKLLHNPSYEIINFSLKSLSKNIENITNLNTRKSFIKWRNISIEILSNVNEIEYLDFEDINNFNKCLDFFCCSLYLDEVDELQFKYFSILSTFYIYNKKIELYSIDGEPKLSEFFKMVPDFINVFLNFKKSNGMINLFTNIDNINNTPWLMTPNIAILFLRTIQHLDLNYKFTSKELVSLVLSYSKYYYSFFHYFNDRSHVIKDIEKLEKENLALINSLNSKFLFHKEEIIFFRSVLLLELNLNCLKKKFDTENAIEAAIHVNQYLEKKYNKKPIMLFYLIKQSEFISKYLNEEIFFDNKNEILKIFNELLSMLSLFPKEFNNSNLYAVHDVYNIVNNLNTFLLNNSKKRIIIYREILKINITFFSFFYDVLKKLSQKDQPIDLNIQANYVLACFRSWNNCCDIIFDDNYEENAHANYLNILNNFEKLIPYIYLIKSKKTEHAMDIVFKSDLTIIKKIFPENWLKNVKQFYLLDNHLLFSQAIKNLKKFYFYFKEHNHSNNVNKQNNSIDVIFKKLFSKLSDDKMFIFKQELLISLYIPRSTANFFYSNSMYKNKNNNKVRLIRNSLTFCKIFLELIYFENSLKKEKLDIRFDDLFELMENCYKFRSNDKILNELLKCIYIIIINDFSSTSIKIKKDIENWFNKFLEVFFFKDMSKLHKENYTQALALPICFFSAFSKDNLYIIFLQLNISLNASLKESSTLKIEELFKYVELSIKIYNKLPTSKKVKSQFSENIIKYYSILSNNEQIELKLKWVEKIQENKSFFKSDAEFLYWEKVLIEYDENIASSSRELSIDTEYCSSEE